MLPVIGFDFSLSLFYCETGLDHEVLNHPVHNLHRILFSHRRTGAPEDALTRTARAPAAMRNLRLAESVGDGATDAVVVAMDVSTPYIFSTTPAGAHIFRIIESAQGSMETVRLSADRREVRYLRKLDA
jgi:hypothetical protein